MFSDDLENPLFLSTTPRAPFWYIICPGFKIFGFWPQMTPNCKIKNLYFVLSFNLSYLKLWLVKYLPRYFKNNSEPEVGHKTGRRLRLIWLRLIFLIQATSLQSFSEINFFKSTHLGNSPAEIAKILGKEQWDKFSAFWKSKIKKKTLECKLLRGCKVYALSRPVSLKIKIKCSVFIEMGTTREVSEGSAKDRLSIFAVLHPRNEVRSSLKSPNFRL